MSLNNGRPALSEKGLLTPSNCLVAIIDLQPQMLFGVSNFDRQSIINNNLVLTKAARVFGVPGCAQHRRNQGLQRQHVAADPSRVSGAKAH